MNTLLQIGHNNYCPPVAQGDISPVNVLQHFVWDGGPITWCILIPLSVITIALTVHYLFTIRRKTLAPPDLAKTLIAGARQGQANSIRQIIRDDNTLLAQAAYAGLSQIGAGRETARAAIDEAVEEQATKLFRKIEYLNMIGNISPMIGLLGTVVGMIKAFNRIFAAGGGMPDAGKLAGDIAVALVTTFWGILIAIPALAAFALFRNRIDAFAAESVKLCDGLLSWVYKQNTAQTAERNTQSSSTKRTPPVSPA
ncbi:MAG: MotA/TolQ/ExbB proton channel family protein [Planctomycetota bacterium]|nr:MAG: MotA/TolQ/ExbB proton channel family protein [Planctomycetota bacterium]